MFCYTDDYDDGSDGTNQADHLSLISAMSQLQVEPRPASSTATEEQSQLAQNEDTIPSSKETFGENDIEQNAIDDPVWKGLMNNVLVYAIADKYFIHKLKMLAEEKFKTLTKKDLPHDFSHIVHEVFNSTPATDKGLRDLVVDKCMLHLDVLLQEEAFKALLHEEAELGCALLYREREERKKLGGHMTKIVESYETQIDARSRELESVKNDRDRLQVLLDKREQNLNNTCNCRHCGASFSCVFRTGESLLRCAVCSTKHHL